MMNAIAHSLIEHWNDEGVRLNPGMPEEQIVGLLRTLSLTPIPQLVSMYRLFDGFQSGSEDSRGFAVLPLALALRSRSKYGVAGVPFASYLLDSYIYEQSMNADTFGAVFLVAPGIARLRIADGLCTFWQSYLHDPNSIWRI